MKKSDLIRKMSTLSGLSQKDSEAALGALIASVRGELSDTGSAEVSGLCRFKKVTRAARPARNPRTGEPIAIPERTIVKAAVSRPNEW